MSIFQLSPQVREYLNKIGETVIDNRDSPYPSWHISDIQRFSFHDLRFFLAEFNLTAYYRYYVEPKGKILQSCVEIAPSVPKSIKYNLNQLFEIDGNESADSPCTYWRVQETSLEEYEILLDKKFHIAKNFLKDYKMICYKYRDYINPPFYPQYNSIAVANSSNKFDIVYFEELYGSTYGIYEKDVVNVLMSLDEKFGVEFVSLDRIQLQKTLTEEDLSEIYSIVSKLCPDIYYEGADIQELSKGKIRLYWEYDI